MNEQTPPLELTADMMLPPVTLAEMALTEPTDAPTLIFDQPTATATRTKLEDAAHAIVDYVSTLTTGKDSETAEQLRRLADDLEDAAVREEAGRLSTPRLLEVTGNVEEKELAARHLDEKANAAESHGQRDARLRDEYGHIASVLRAAANELRTGLHLPELILQGRVIRYNDENDSGIRHASAIDALVADIHGRNVRAGWWHDLATGQPKERNPYELISLCHSELSEAVEGLRKDLMDTHLPTRKMEEVEMADTVIRIADYCGGRGLDLGGAIDDKLAYNAQRSDHKIENRLLPGGKKA
jgi:hypothetical protein